MATIKDIAKLANVSTATVSYVLNDTGSVSTVTREKVLRVIGELQYTPNKIAKSLKLNRTHTIGVIVEDITVFNAPEIIDGIYEYAENNGYSTILTNLRLYKLLGVNFQNKDSCKQNLKNVPAELLSKQVEGIIYVGLHARDVSSFLNISNIPIVYNYCYTSSKSDYSVNMDDEAAAFEATNYLVGQGHRKIAVISGFIDSIPSHDRLSGYHRALKDNQLPFQLAYIKVGDWEFSSGYSLTKELLQQLDPPTAILTMNDIMASGVLEACKELDIRVPEQLSVIGFDNREFSAFLTPKLTTMKLPLHEMGAKSMEKIIDLIENRLPVNQQDYIKCELIVRETVSYAAI